MDGYGPKKLRVGLIVDDSDQGSLAWDLFERSKQAGLYEIDTLIVNTHHRSGPQQGRLSRFASEIRTRGFKQFARRVGYGLLYRLEKAALTRNGGYREFFRTHSLEKFAATKIYVTPVISPSGLIYSYPQDELERIKSAGVDVLARYGGGILKGGVLTICRFGILSFHHADNDVNRGGPPGFWEVFHKQPSTGFIIQRLTEELDGGDVLVKGSIATSGFYLLNQVMLFTKSTVFMHQLLERIGKANALPAAHPKRPHAYQLYKVPGVPQQLSYTFYFLKFAAETVLNRKLSRTHRWGVAYLFAENWRSAVLRKAVAIKNPPNRFLADPFVIQRGDAHFCFVEDFDYALGRAAISAYKIEKGGHTRLGPVIQEDFHLSFPYLFEEGGELYMCPETAQANEIRLYKCMEFPMKWELHKVLMRNTQAVDSCLFKHGGKWWMLTNMDSAGTGDYGSELHAFHADRFDSEHWTPHQDNPLVFDSMRARNGGMIFEDDGIYRVFQVQGFNKYGEAMGVARIRDLSENTYAEDVVADIPAKFMNGIAGAHSFSFNKGLVALDVVRLERTSH
jgi:hypothetical protein